MTLRISDHALVRFIERAGGHDVERLRSTIATSLGRAKRTADMVGQAEYEIRADGLIYCVKNNVVTTILFSGGD